MDMNFVTFCQINGFLGIVLIDCQVSTNVQIIEAKAIKLLPYLNPFMAVNFVCKCIVNYVFKHSDSSFQHFTNASVVLGLGFILNF